MHGPGTTRHMGGRLGEQIYLSALENVVHPSVDQIYSNNSFIVQQDNSLDILKG